MIETVSQRASAVSIWCRSEEHTSELQSHVNLVCRLLLEKKKKKNKLKKFKKKNNKKKIKSNKRITIFLPFTLFCLFYVSIIFYSYSFFFFFFFFNDTATTEIYTLSLHDALPISARLTGTSCTDPSSSARA